MNTEPPIRIVITGISTLRNRGVEALVVPLIDGILSRLGRVSFTVLSSDPDFDSRVLGTRGVSVLDDAFAKSCGTNMRRIRAGIARAVNARLWPEIAKSESAVKTASLVIASGGDIFGSDYGGIEGMLASLEMAIRSKVPVVFPGHSIGPFATQAELDRWARIARRSAFVAAREKETYRYLLDRAGLDPRLVYHTTDIAMLVSPASGASADRKWESLGLDPGLPVVACAPSQGISSYGKIDRGIHLASWVRIVDMIVSQLGAQVVLIPHVQRIEGREDDRLLAGDIISASRSASRLRLAGGQWSAADFKFIISRCEMIVAERMHAAIAGISTGVCPFVIGYSVKGRGILSDALADDDLLANLLTGVDAHTSEGRIEKMLPSAWASRLRAHETLQRRRQTLQTAASKNIDLIVNSLTTS